jgi:hypothetical protein
MRSAHSLTGGISERSSDGAMVQAVLKSKPKIPEATLLKYENAVVDYVVEGGTTLRGAGSPTFAKLVTTLTHGYEPPSTRTVLRRMNEMYCLMQPLIGKFFSTLDVSFSLALDGWSNRSPKGFFVVTAHWVEAAALITRSILLTVLDVKCGPGVGKRVGDALFEHLKRMGHGTVTRLLNVVSDNGSDATSAVSRLFQLVNTYVGVDQLRPENHVRCADHSVQLAVLNVLKFLKGPTEQLRGALVKIRRGKVMRQQHRLEASQANFGSKEPTHQDSPTRWSSTHEMCKDAFKKRLVLDSNMDQFGADIGYGALSTKDWNAIETITEFLRPPRQVMESLAADKCPTLHLVPMTYTHLLNHCDNSEASSKMAAEGLTTVEF